MYESVKLNMYYLAYLYFIYMIQKYVNACIQVFAFHNALYLNVLIFIYFYSFVAYDLLHYLETFLQYSLFLY